METYSTIDLESYVAGARMMLIRLITNGLLSSTPKIHGANEKLTLKERKRFVDASLVANMLKDGNFLKAFVLEKPIEVKETTTELSNGKKVKAITYYYEE